jgi:hypothetical protein
VDAMTPAACAVCGKPLDRGARGTRCQHHQPGPTPPQRPYRAPGTPDVSRDPAARRYDPEGDGALSKQEQDAANRDTRTKEQRRDDDAAAQNERRRQGQNRGKA